MEAMSRAQLNLVYDGPALQEHQMAVRDLAPALLAMGALVERANELFNHDEVKVSVDVHASFEAGSFGIDFDLGQGMLQRLLDLAGRHDIVEVSVLLSLLGLSVRDGVHGVIQVVRWLRRRGIGKIEPIGDDRVRLWIDDAHIDTEGKVLKLLQDYKIRKELENLIAAPLQREGIDDFATIDKPVKRVMAHVTKTEAHYFVAPPAEDELLEDVTYEANLQVLTVAFKDDNKWRFTDGGTSFFAPILDEGFLRRVALNQEQFAKDDIIRAKVRRVQRLAADGLKIEYEVLEILTHRNASPRVQLRIDFNGDGGGPSAS